MTVPGLSQSMSFLNEVHPTLRKKGIDHINAAYNQGVSLVVTSGYRTLESQQGLYDQGRITPGNIVTNAKPGNSWHNHKLGYDVAFLDDSGNSYWPPQSDPRWQIVGNTGINQGLNWGASFNDYPHFDWHPNITLAEAKLGLFPKTPTNFFQVVGGILVSAFMYGIWYNYNYPNTRINRKINNKIDEIKDRFI